MNPGRARRPKLPARHAKPLSQQNHTQLLLPFRAERADDARLFKNSGNLLMSRTIESSLDLVPYPAGLVCAVEGHFNVN